MPHTRINLPKPRQAESRKIPESVKMTDVYQKLTSNICRFCRGACGFVVFFLGVAVSIIAFSARYEAIIEYGDPAGTLFVYRVGYVAWRLL